MILWFLQTYVSLFTTDYMALDFQGQSAMQSFCHNELVFMVVRRWAHESLKAFTAHGS